MKDEAARMSIKELIGIRSKMYSYSTDHKIKELTEDTIEDIKNVKD